MQSSLFRLARSISKVRLFRRMIARVIPWMPLNKLIDNESWTAFHHPEPAYSLHILLVPKRGIRGVAELGENDGLLLVELFQAVQELVARFDLERQGYRLILNGGKYQDVPQLHFHLVSED